jgi:hypothetical protein
MPDKIGIRVHLERDAAEVRAGRTAKGGSQPGRENLICNSHREHVTAMSVPRPLCHPTTDGPGRLGGDRGQFLVGRRFEATTWLRQPGPQVGGAVTASPGTPSCGSVERVSAALRVAWDAGQSGPGQSPRRAR